MENNDIGTAIGKILEDPEALSRIMSMANGIMANMKQNEGVDTAEAPSDANVPTNTEQETELRQSEQPETKGDMSIDTGKLLASLLGGIKPKVGDPRCALLLALKPYMSKQRADSIDTLIKAMSVSELATGFLSGNGLFS